jgi:hypothetical protein
VRDQRHAPVAFYPGKDRVPILQEAAWAPWQVWTGAENLASTGIRSPDCLKFGTVSLSLLTAHLFIRFDRHHVEKKASTKRKNVSMSRIMERVNVSR